MDERLSCLRNDTKEMSKAVLESNAEMTKEITGFGEFEKN